MSKRDPKTDPRKGDHVPDGAYVRVVYSVEGEGEDVEIRYWRYRGQMTSAKWARLRSLSWSSLYLGRKDLTGKRRSADPVPA